MIRWVPYDCHKLVVLGCQQLHQGFIAKPCALGLKVQANGPQKAQPNAILEKVFTAITKHPDEKRLEGLSKQLDWDVRSIQRWFRQRRNQEKPSTLTKFCESILSSLRCWRNALGSRAASSWGHAAAEPSLTRSSVLRGTAFSRMEWKSINCMKKLVQIQTDIIFLSKCKQMDIVPKGLKVEIYLLPLYIYLWSPVPEKATAAGSCPPRFPAPERGSGREALTDGYRCILGSHQPPCHHDRERHCPPPPVSTPAAVKTDEFHDINKSVVCSPVVHKCTNRQSLQHLILIATPLVLVAAEVLQIEEHRVSCISNGNENSAELCRVRASRDMSETGKWYTELWKFFFKLLGKLRMEKVGLWELVSSFPELLVQIAVIPQSSVKMSHEALHQMTMQGTLAYLPKEHHIFY
ncbi:LAG1 longevity assurance like protein 6 [Chelonia mydas]|uniref:LAG1 longevity assurance like protein 6 n=1 Tax=Chelonia mydas TaxID=8469 RepID=M7C2R6_CHEMY|nr:LAG1 longevity assurance like protein 6 [Chelonia mydas]